jgi:hypothetical protein
MIYSHFSKISIDKSILGNNKERGETAMRTVMFKVVLALRNTKMVYRLKNIVIGYNFVDDVYDLYTVVSKNRLVYFDNAKTKNEVLLKLQILK